VRYDREVLGAKIADSPAWEKRNARFKDLFTKAQDKDGKPVVRAHPFSAHERNAFFVNESQGTYFSKLSALSGTDSPADSRAVALIDYDRDGDHDLALANANAPSFNLFRTAVPTPGNFLAVRLTGGAGLDGNATPSLSNRDAIGARLTLKTASGMTLTRTLQAGEGFGAQNSKVLLFGLGKDKHAVLLTIRWPSGRSFSTTTGLTSGQLIHLEETADGARQTNGVYGPSMK
jgi:hypothetical protein